MKKSQEARYLLPLFAISGTHTCLETISVAAVLRMCSVYMYTFCQHAKQLQLIAALPYSPAHVAYYIDHLTNANTQKEDPL